MGKVKQLLKDEITERDVKLALRTLRKNMRGKVAAASNAAAMYLLDQKFGKPRQSTEVTFPEGIKIIRDNR